MVMSVTGGRRNGSSGLRAKRFSPRSHILSKQPGEVVNVSWPVTNTGSSPKDARLQIFEAGQVVASLPAVGILGGQTVTLAVAWTIPLTTPSGATLNAGAFLSNVTNPALPQPFASHTFQVNVSALAGQLVAVGEPTIT